MSIYGKGPRGVATKLHSCITRDRGECEAQGWQFWEHECSGRLETAHIVSRSYSFTRTELANAFCLCSAAHRFFTANPVEFGKFVADERGSDAYDELYATAQSGARSRLKFDWPAEVERLTRIARDLELHEAAKRLGVTL